VGGHPPDLPCSTAPVYAYGEKSVNNSSTRGHAFKLSKHFSRVKYRAFSFSNRFIDVWKSLENDIVTAPSLYSFKCRLKSVDFNVFFVLRNVQGWCNLSVYF